MFGVKHYVEPGAKELPKGKRMPFDIYGAAMANMIVVCTDAVIIDQEQRTMWLARRIRKPAANTWWWIGGTLLRGRKEQEGMAETFFRETGLRINPLRFVFVAMARYWWKDRAQEPEGVGTDGLAYTFSVALSPEERAQVALGLDAEEYEQHAGLREFSYAALVNEGVHPVILDVYDEIFPKNTER